MKTTSFAGILSDVAGFFFGIHWFSFSILLDAITDCQKGYCGDAIFQFFIGLILLLCLLALDLIIIYGIYLFFHWIFISIKTKEIKHYKVIGTVTSQEHKPSYITYIFVEKTMVPSYHLEEFITYVQYGGVTEVFYSQDLYNQYNKNDPIPLVLVEKLDKHGNVLQRALELR